MAATTMCSNFASKWSRGRHLKPPEFEHIFVAVITFPPFLLCKSLLYQLVAYCVCFKMICKKSPYVKSHLFHNSTNTANYSSSWQRNHFNFGSDFWACNINSIKRTLLYKFRIRKWFVMFAKFISKHETGFCGGLLYDCFTKKVYCCLLFTMSLVFAVVYFLTNCFQNYRV